MIDELYWVGIGLSAIGGYQVLKNEVREKLRASFRRGCEEGRKDAAFFLGHQAGSEYYAEKRDKPYAMDSHTLDALLASSDSEETEIQWRTLYEFELARADGWLVAGQDDADDSDVAWQAQMFLRGRETA